MGVATGCGFKEIYRFPHTTYPLLLYLYFFQHPYFFVHFLKCFSFLFQYFLKLHFKYEIIFSRSINTTCNYGHPTASI